jgi:hypothetical protein
MSESFSAESSTSASDIGPAEYNGLVRRLAAGLLLMRLAVATGRGVQHCFFADNAATHTFAPSLAESSTELIELRSDLRARMLSMLEAANNDLIEDGMPNSVKEGLPALIDRNFGSVIPALLSGIETGRTSPIVAAEILKELGRLRSVSSHAMRRWVLERALRLTSPFIRDGAGLGLARLGDPGAIPYLRQSVESELNPQTRADLQTVIDELAEMIPDGTVAGGD